MRSTLSLLYTAHCYIFALNNCWAYVASCMTLHIVQLVNHELALHLQSLQYSIVSGQTVILLTPGVLMHSYRLTHQQHLCCVSQMSKPTFPMFKSVAPCCSKTMEDAHET